MDSKNRRSEEGTRYDQNICLNSVNYFTDFCESYGSDVASEQNIEGAKILLLK